MSRSRTLLPLLLAMSACARQAPGPPQQPPAHARTAPDAAAATQSVDDARVNWRLPGEFSAGDSLERLQQRHGAGNVRAADVPGAEGETRRGAILYPDDPARRAYLHFRDDRRLRGLRLVEVVDAGSRWRLDDGVFIGMPLARLVELNGKPLRFTGFDWDYGGAISDWNGGRLQPPADAPLRRGIRLGHAPDTRAAYPMGDATFSSDDPRYPELGRVARVVELRVAFGSDDAP